MFSLTSKTSKNKTNKTERISVMIEIQSGLVSGALISSVENAPLTKLYSTAREVSVSNGIDGESLTDAMLKGVASVALELHEKGMAKLPAKSPISSIHYVLSTPWIISQSRVVKLHFETETEMTEAKVHGLLNDERTVLLERFKKENFGHEYEFDLVFIEQKIFDIKLNGYSVERYTGKKVHDFEISFAVTLGSDKILKLLHKTVGEVFSMASIAPKAQIHHSGLLLQYVALRSLIAAADHKDEYASIHVHGELTDMIIVRRGMSSSIASFPFGIRTLLRKMNAIEPNQQQVNESLFKMYEEDRLSAEEKIRVENILFPLLGEWISFSGLPHLIYLSICSESKEHAGIFRKVLENGGYKVESFNRPLLEIYMTALQDML